MATSLSRPNRDRVVHQFGRTLVLGLAVILHFFSSVTPSLAQRFDKKTLLRPRLAKAALNRPRIAGNDFYEVVVEDFIGNGVGLYSVRTGPNHPVTRRFRKPQDLLAGASDTLSGSSYTTIRSYRSRTDYVQTPVPDSTGGYRVFWLDQAFANDDSVVADSSFIQPIFDGDRITGFRVLYPLPGLPQPGGPIIIDTLAITQIIQVHGRTFDDSWVEATTIVKNLGQLLPTTIGIRYLWDLNIGNLKAGDDGPVLRERGGDLFSPFEQNIAPVQFAFYMAAANDTLRDAAGNITVQPPAYNFFGSALTPAILKRAPRQPERVQQVFWPQAFFSAFDYTCNPDLRVIGGQDDALSRLTGGDNAMQYFWGETPERAITLWPGQTVEVTQALFGSLPGEEPSTVVDWVPPICEIVGIEPGPPKTITVMVRDLESGLASIRVRDQGNVSIDIPDVEPGTVVPVMVVATALDETQPFQFTITVRDLAGNVSECDPILLTLRPDLNAGGHRLEPVWADRYFYISNQGLEQIEVNLNGRDFVLRTKDVAGRGVFPMPAWGEMTIDLARYLKIDHNVLTLAFSGPPSSRADVIIADANMKAGVDLVLDLDAVPRQFALSQNLPNPFRGRTVIGFELPEFEKPQRVKLNIYNLLGQLVRTLVDENLSSAARVVAWDGRDSLGREVAAGVYLYRLHAGDQQLTKKMALLSGK